MFDLDKLRGQRPTIDDGKTADIFARIEESKAALSESPQTGGKKRGPYKKRGESPHVGTSPGVGSQLAESFGPVLETVIGLPFDFAAHKTNFPGCRLVEPEKKALSSQLALCIREFAPQISGKEAVAISFLGTLAMVVASKYMAYAQYLEEKANNARVVTAAPNGH